MLIEFRIGNFRSIRDEQVLTLEAGRVGEADDVRPRHIDGIGGKLLPVAAVYGANASGKSNLLAGLRFMRDAVDTSSRLWAPDGGVPRQAFAWAGRGAEPSLFEVSILIDTIRYRYGFTCNDDRIVEEWLYVWPKGRRQTWFFREGDELKLGDHLRGDNRQIEQVSRSNALFLSTAAQLGHKQLMPIFQWFTSLGTLNVLEAIRIPRYPFGFTPRRKSTWLFEALGKRAGLLRQASLFAEDSDSEARFLTFFDLLRAADIGIVDLKMSEDAEYQGWGSRGQVLFRHQGASEDAWLPLEQESGGTKTLFRLGPALVDALFNGSVLLIDELEANLHPLLALWVVRRFNDPQTNPRNAQLIFATHDTNLLGTTAGEPPLRRDQIWLTEKDQEGATCLYPLTDFKPRRAENLERGYLQGRYGAIPYLGDLIKLGG